jgi:hypothetical protein
MAATSALMSMIGVARRAGEAKEAKEAKEAQAEFGEARAQARPQPEAAGGRGPVHTKSPQSPARKARPR